MACNRCLQRLRFKSPTSSNVYSRNRTLLSFLLIFPLCALLLWIPGGEIANFKYQDVEGAAEQQSIFVTTFTGGGTDDDVISRELRLVEIGPLSYTISV